MSCALTLLGLEAAASEFDCSYLGLLIAKHRPPLGFGGLAQWLKASPDLGTALTKGHEHVGIFMDPISGGISIPEL